ncbi:MAG: hypothetical protein J1E16_10555, partial [Muribaculaceae bacterium]|nr:hypothetical protein [Muribaculaceae bacterium]
EHNTFNVGVLGSSPRRITTQTTFRGGFLYPYIIEFHHHILHYLIGFQGPAEIIIFALLMMCSYGYCGRY